MKRLMLGQSEIEVSAVCLGTMTFGNQTGEADAHAQMDRAVGAGITFLDCAEMYPVNPVRAETVGNSEQVIGRWLAARGRRDDVEIATKVSGRNGGFARDGQGFDGSNIAAAVDASLQRLQTDVIDLYQLHWPDRGSYAFRQNWGFDPSANRRDEVIAHMDAVLDAMDEVIRAGKVRAFGLSNESAWGTAQWLARAEAHGGPRVNAIQNEYSLLYRMFDTDLAEVSHYDNVPLLAYSPLAAGLLTGKYQRDQEPEGSRAAVDRAHGGAGNLGGRRTPRALAAVDAYQELAQAHGMSLTHLALNWLSSRPFTVIPILGATSDAQLAEQLDGLSQPLSAELIKAVDALHHQWAMPY